MYVSCEYVWIGLNHQDVCSARQLSGVLWEEVGFFQTQLRRFSCPNVPQSVTRETIMFTIQMHFKLYRALYLFHEQHVNVLWQWTMVYDLTKSATYQRHILETQLLYHSLFLTLHTFTRPAPPSSAWLLLLPWDHKHFFVLFQLAAFHRQRMCLVQTVTFVTTTKAEISLHVFRCLLQTKFL